jgi:hypothetical protein
LGEGGRGSLVTTFGDILQLISHTPHPALCRGAGTSPRRRGGSGRSPATAMTSARSCVSGTANHEANLAVAHLQCAPTLTELQLIPYTAVPRPQPQPHPASVPVTARPMGTWGTPDSHGTHVHGARSTSTSNSPRGTVRGTLSTLFPRCSCCNTSTIVCCGGGSGNYLSPPRLP